MKNFTLASALVTVSALPTSSGLAGQPFDYLQMDKFRCNLVHAGTMLKDVVYRGRKSFGRCQVVIPANEFFQRYSHCALSGVLAGPNKRITCDFGYYDRARTKVHFTNGPDNACFWVCTRP